MKLEAKSPLATLGKFMVDFNDVFPTLFLRFYKSADFDKGNRFPHTTKLKELTSLPIFMEFTPKDTVSKVLEKMQKALSVKNIEIVYYPKDASSAYRLGDSKKLLTIDEINKMSHKEGWLTQKELKKHNLS
jgi:hypothetical protein